MFRQIPGKSNVVKKQKKFENPPAIYGSEGSFSFSLTIKPFFAALIF